VRFLLKLYGGRELKNIQTLYEEADDFSDLFTIVELTTKETLGEDRPGIMLGLLEMGVSRNQFIGGFYIVGTNEIYLNRTALRMVEHEYPDLYKPYVFYLLLHEYIHSLGFGEQDTRKITASICLKVFGRDHMATKMAIDGLSYFFPYKFAHPEMYNPPDASQRGRVQIIRTRRKSDMMYV